MRSLRIPVVGVVYREAAIRGANIAIHGLARALRDPGHDVALLQGAVNAIPDVVEGGVTGLLCPVDDVAAFAEALGKLAGDSDLPPRLGEAARRRALERWRWPRVVERLEGEVCAPLLRAGSGAAGL